MGSSITSNSLKQAALKLSDRAAWATDQPISKLMTQALANPSLISLAAGFVDQATLPAEETLAVVDELLSDKEAAQAALQYGTTIGYAPLREAVLDQLRAADSTVCKYAGTSIDQLVITAGSNQLLQLIGEALLDQGDIVLCASPSYFVYLGLLENQGARSWGVPTDEHGIIPEALEAELQRLDNQGDLNRVKAIYCVSYFDNPCGVSLANDRKAAIVEIAKRWSRDQRILIIDDIAYRELHYTTGDRPSMRAYDPEGTTVITAGTFSKSFSPGIRVGWGLLPKDLVAPVCEQKGNFDFGSPNFAQHLVYRAISTGRFETHTELLRKSYHKKMDAMLNAATEFFSDIEGVEWIVPQGGLYVWMTLPEQIDAGPDSLLCKRAIEAGVLYVPGQYCFPKEGTDGKNTMRLSFGVQDETSIQQGMKALSVAVRGVIAGQ